MTDLTDIVAILKPRKAPRPSRNVKRITTLGMTWWDGYEDIAVSPGYGLEWFYYWDKYHSDNINSPAWSEFIHRRVERRFGGHAIQAIDPEEWRSPIQAQNPRPKRLTKSQLGKGAPIPSATMTTDCPQYQEILRKNRERARRRKQKTQEIFGTLLTILKTSKYNSDRD